MAEQFTIKLGDLLPTLEATLFDESGASIDLTGATVLLLLKPASGQAPALSFDATVVDATAGTVRYDWPEPDAFLPLVYLAEWQVTFPGDLIETFPNDGYFVINIVPSLISDVEA